MKEDEDLTIPMEDTAVWCRLKEMLANVVAALPDNERVMYTRFMTKHWIGHAPRSREIATMTSKMTLLQREKSRLVALLNIPTK